MNINIRYTSSKTGAQVLVESYHNINLLVLLQNTYLLN